MPSHVYRYQFLPSLDIIDVEATVTLAFLATESLHGDSRARLETQYNFDAEQRICVIHDSGEVGRDFNRLFLGFITREFGPDSFGVDRLEGPAKVPAVA